MKQKNKEWMNKQNKTNNETNQNKNETNEQSNKKEQNEKHKKDKYFNEFVIGWLMNTSLPFLSKSMNSFYCLMKYLYVTILSLWVRICLSSL